LDAFSECSGRDAELQTMTLRARYRECGAKRGYVRVSGYKPPR
jgi:hypothetical protein